MKKGLSIGIMAVFVVVVGGVSMGCIDAPVTIEVPEEIKVVEVPEVVEVVEETTVVIELVVVEVESEVEVITYKTYPTLDYSGCYVRYPENVAGFDTPKERAAILQAELNTKIDMVYDGKVTQQRYQYRGKQAYMDFYTELYQDKLDKYIKLYCGLGNRILTDSNDPIVRDVGAFNFTSPWGARNLGNGSFVYDTYEGTVSFIGSEETASGRAVQVNSTVATIGNMYYTYMGSSATLPGNTEVSF